MLTYQFFTKFAILTIFFVPFFGNQTTSAAPGGCSSADFKLASTFEATLSNGFPTAAYATADFDGDGKIDIAETDSSANTIVVLLNDGTGRPVTSKAYPGGSGPTSVVAV